jgi:hypothetical protein
LKTDQEKIEVYERLLHELQMNAEVALNAEGVRRLIGNICRWSYAHRTGNGELSDEQQQELIDKAFDRLLD